MSPTICLVSAFLYVTDPTSFYTLQVVGKSDFFATSLKCQESLQNSNEILQRGSFPFFVDAGASEWLRVTIMNVKFSL